MVFHPIEHRIPARLTWAAAALLLVSACGNKAAPRQPETSAAPPPEAPAWSYDGDTGPDRWGQIDPAFATCETGQEQSPIDLPAQPTGAAPAIEVHYQDGPLRVVNKGYTIEVEVEVEVEADQDQGSYIELGGVRYHLRQLHFHHPGEHTVAGEARDLVIHLVHASDAGEFAVLAVFFEPGEEAHPLIADILAHAPSQPGQRAAPEGVSINPAALLPDDRAHHRYRGSLTTPPCSEGVLWHVFARPLTVTAAQAAALAELMPRNARPVQPLHGRAIE